MSDKIDINSPEVKEAIEAAISEAVTGLKNKNSELLGEIKKLKKNAEISPDDYNALRQEKEELEAKLQETTKALKTAQSDVEKLNKQVATESEFATRLIVDGGLQAALLENGVTNPVHLKAAKALLMPSASIKVEGDKRTAILGDKDIVAAVKEWAAGDEGKHFVAATVNSGSGAPGGGGKPAGKSVNRATFDQMSQSERIAFSKDGGVVAND